MKNTLIKYLAIISCLAIAPINILPSIQDAINQLQVSPPELIISSPVDGEMYGTSENLNLEFSVENFTFVDFKGNTVPFPGDKNAGQARLWIDPPIVHGPEDAKKILSTESVSLRGLGAGRHKIVIELVQNNLESYSPPVRAEAVFYIATSRSAPLFIGIVGIIAVATYLLFMFWRKKKSTKHGN